MPCVNHDRLAFRERLKRSALRKYGIHAPLPLTVDSSLMRHSPSEMLNSDWLKVSHVKCLSVHRPVNITV